MKKLLFLCCWCMISCNSNNPNSYSESYPAIDNRQIVSKGELINNSTLDKVNHLEYSASLIDKNGTSPLGQGYFIHIDSNELVLNDQSYKLSDLNEFRVNQTITQREYSSNRSCSKIRITYNGYAVGCIVMSFTGYIWWFEPIVKRNSK